MTLLPKDVLASLPKLLVGGGVGATLTIVLVLAQKEPAMIVETVRGWGAASLIGLVALVAASRGFERVMDLGKQMVESSAQTALSQQSLADAVNRIASRDEREREEQRRLISFVGSQQEKILERLDNLGQEFRERGRGAHA